MSHVLPHMSSIQFHACHGIAPAFAHWLSRSSALRLRYARLSTSASLRMTRLGRFFNSLLRGPPLGLMRCWCAKPRVALGLASRPPSVIPYSPPPAHSLGLPPDLRPPEVRKEQSLLEPFVSLRPIRFGIQGQPLRFLCYLLFNSKLTQKARRRRAPENIADTLYCVPPLPSVQ